MIQIQTPHDIYYFAFALLMSLFMIILIPRDDIKRLFGVSFVWGKVFCHHCLVTRRNTPSQLSFQEKNYNILKLDYRLRVTNKMTLASTHTPAAM